MTKVAKISDETFERVKPLLDQGLSFSEALDRLLSVGDSQPSGPATARENEPTTSSAIKPVCIWPNIRDYKPLGRDDSGNVTEWSKEEFECPIRLEQRDITAVELSKNHCTKCPIFRAHEIKQKRKGRGYRRSSEPGVGRPISERYPHLFNKGVGSYSDQIGWGQSR